MVQQVQWHNNITLMIIICALLSKYRLPVPLISYSPRGKFFRGGGRVKCKILTPPPPLFSKAIETRALLSSRHKILEIVKFVITEKKHCYKGVFTKFLFAPIMDERVLPFMVGSWYLRVKKIFCFILKQVLDGYG